MRPRPLVLAILDGFGLAPDAPGNAITRAKTPSLNRFLREYPAMSLYASGLEVGLSFGEMGNSEVGHLNIGAGRVYYQTLPRIRKSIVDESFFKNPALLGAVQHAKKNSSSLHLMGLVSPGNIHASDEHLYALLELCRREKIKKVFIHAFLDGRDTRYNGAFDFVSQLLKKTHELKVGELASLSGRFYAMDRDNRWERIEQAYRAIADGKSEETFDDPLEAIKTRYEKEIFDEEFPPTVITRRGRPIAEVKDNDAIIYFNFRPDRARELTKAFALPGFSKFSAKNFTNLFFATMTEYEKELPVSVAFPPQVVRNSLAEVISAAGLTQYHVAETEKYAHITFFLNGTIEDPFPLEDREIIPSPRVSTYDQAPEMSAKLITEKVNEAIAKRKYDVIILNFANPDMVGHTGDFDATIRAVESVDWCLGEIAEHTLAEKGVMLITADHGNAEEVINLETKTKDKEHSTNPVPFIIIGERFRGLSGPAGDPPNGDLSLLPPVGMLSDVAPTVLSLLEIPIPQEMTGRPLV